MRTGSAPNGGTGTNGRSGSRFMNDFSSGANAFQTGVDQNIWANGRNGISIGTRHDPGSGVNSTGESNGLQGRPDSSSSRLVNGSGFVGQPQASNTSPVGQRTLPAARFPISVTTQQSSSNLPENAGTSSTFNGSGSLDPSASIFSSRNSAESLQGLSNATSSRGSSRHGMGHQGESARNHRSSQSPIDLSGWSPRSRVNSNARFPRGSDSGIASRWDNLPEIGMFASSHNNSQVASQSNSQTASRNNSVPPSRHGAESSPTELSFQSANFDDLRSGSISSERPTSQGLYTTVPFGQMMSSGARRPSITPVLEAMSDASPMRVGSASSRVTVGPSSNRGSDQLLMTGLSDSLRDMGLGNSFPGLHANPDQHLTMTYESDNGFPVLSQVQRAPQNSSSVRSTNNTGYLDQIRHVRNYGQGTHSQLFSQQNYGFNGSWQYQSQLAQAQAQAQTQAGMSRNPPPYGMQANLQSELYEIHPVTEQQQGYSMSHTGRYDANGSPGYRPVRGPVAGRHSFTAAPNVGSLISGNHWAERFRANGNQKYIETTPECRLRDAMGFVARFCGDQAGSRFLQDKLEIANSDEKEIVFQELLPNAIPLCIDPFGNYVIQKFFEHGTQRQKEQLANQMRGKVKDLSMNMYGCRCIQKAFEHVLVEQQAVLVRELRPCLFEISQDQHGNHVVQKAIERLPAADIQFIVHGYYDHVLEMSNNSYGCRVIQRLLEFDDDATRSRLIDEIQKCALQLVRNPYGNYVVQHIIEHGRFEDRDRLISLIQPLVIDLMSNKFASNVVEKCLKKGTAEQRTAMVAKIAEMDLTSGQPKHLRAAIQSNFGNYVVQRILKTLTPGPWEQFANLVSMELKVIIKEQVDSDRTPDKKVAEIQKQLLKGPRGPDSSDSDNEDSSRDGRQSRPSISVSSHSPQTARHKKNSSGEVNSAETPSTPPSLARTEDSPESSSAPSTSDSQADDATVCTSTTAKFQGREKLATG